MGAGQQKDQKPLLEAWKFQGRRAEVEIMSELIYVRKAQQNPNSVRFKELPVGEHVHALGG